MVAQGSSLRADPAGWAQATEVAAETMLRVRTNVETLVRELPGLGYVFTAAEAPYLPPGTAVGADLDQLETAVGPLPLALRAFYQHVGQVDLVGHHPDRTFVLTDPLVINAPPDWVLDQHQEWLQDRGTEWDRGDFTVDLAPDSLHKAGISGGGPYGMAVPDPRVDGLFLAERHQTTFVNYLRVAFCWCGFPGWDRGTLDGWATLDQPFPTELRELARSLLPI